MTRFDRPEQLTSWAGLTPKHHESGTTVHRGRITKQGSRLVRWAAVESVQRAPKGSPVGQRREPRRRPTWPQHRRGRPAARQQVEHVYYALRDGHVHALTGTRALRRETVRLPDVAR